MKSVINTSVKNDEIPERNSDVQHNQGLLLRQADKQTLKPRSLAFNLCEELARSSGTEVFLAIF